MNAACAWRPLTSHLLPLTSHLLPLTSYLLPLTSNKTLKHVKDMIKNIPWRAIFKFLSMLFATLAGSAIVASCVNSIM